MIQVITDKARLRAYLARDRGLHMYELGDLDDFFWPSTRWYALDDGTALDGVVLLYDAPPLPTIVALGPVEPLARVIAEIRDDLPPELYGHLSPGVYAALAPRYTSEPHGDHLKMVLADRTRLPAATVARLGPNDRLELEDFLADAYPGNWFDPRMLETGHYVAIRDPAIVAAGGVHVCSPTDGIAALGNIAVAPARRGSGLGRQITAGVCGSLLDAGIELVGLNVRADNRAAIACYESIGFHTVARYELHHLAVPSSLSLV